MQCSQCQAENPERAKFCMECAAPLARKCSACGAGLLPTAKFCVECAHPMGQTAPTPAAAPLPASYTPQHLAERIVSSRGALEGERKQVTVLFADLKGSMELLADRDPEEARAILDPVLERMMEAVHRYEGTVNQVMGDGIMALFGAPLAHEDHAVRACYAALRMQESVRQYAGEVRRAEGITPQIRVGLNSGEVVVRSIGSDLHMDYTAVGQTTHLAARMEQVATPGTVLVAPDTLQLVEGYVQVKPLGPVQLKGLSEPVEVYELLGAGTARSRLQAAAARGLTKFVGRDAELDTLRRTLEQAGSGRGQIVAVVGEPGVGKSRLVWEFSHSHRTQGWLVLEAGSVSYGKATSYLPVIDLLKNYCGIDARDDTRRIREKLTGKLLTLDPALQPTLPVFLALLDVPVDDPNWEALDPPQRRQRTLDACKRLLLGESQVQPLLLVFEDLHWIDAETQALLDSVVDGLPAARILLLVNYRPEYEHAWHRKTYYQQLRLDPLPPESAEALLHGLLGGDPSFGALRRLLVERTEGNPFFLEESVRSLVETGALTGERGAYMLARPFESAQVPATVQAVLAARIDRLAPEHKRLLQAAAVIGKDVPHVLLQAIAELPEAALREGLARLQAAEFLYETSLFPELEYTFKHALTHEVVYASLLRKRRRALHAQIAEGIEAMYGDRLIEHVERLAHHTCRGEVWIKGVAYLRQAGTKAEAHSAHREAKDYFEQALETLTHLEESRGTHEQAIDLRCDLRTVLVPLGEEARLEDHLREAEVAATALGDQDRLGRVSALMCRQFWWAGDHQRAVESGQRALAIARKRDDAALEVQANFYLGLAHSALGDYDRAASCFRSNIESIPGGQLLERFGLPLAPSVGSRQWLAGDLSERGEFAEALALGQEAVQLGDKIQHPFTCIGAYQGLGRIYLRKGDFEQALPLLEQSVELCQQWQFRTQFGAVAPWLGYAYALSKRITEATRVAEQGVEEAIALKYMGQQAIRVTCLGEVYRLADRIEDAREATKRGVRLARDHGERPNEAWALRLLAELAQRADPPQVEQAESYYRQALTLAEELGMRPLAAHCHLGLGTLYQKIGRHDEAQAELTTAAEMYRAMEMTFWLEKTEVALAQVAR